MLAHTRARAHTHTPTFERMPLRAYTHTQAHDLALADSHARTHARTHAQNVHAQAHSRTQVFRVITTAALLKSPASQAILGNETVAKVS